MPSCQASGRHVRVVAVATVLSVGSPRAVRGRMLARRRATYIAAGEAGRPTLKPVWSGGHRGASLVIGSFADVGAAGAPQTAASGTGASGWGGTPAGR